MQITTTTQEERPSGAIARPQLTRWLPEIVGIVWLGFLALAIWLHTHASMQPPVYDAFTYYEKAWRFWSAVHHMHRFNPLNLEPTFRPPGTVLMSYPFGFHQDPRGFYFRSVYLPDVLLFFSVLIAAYDIRDSRSARARTVLTAAFFCTLTMLYQFEYGAGEWSYWGLVDGFLVGLAALAAAAVWRGTQAQSARWTSILALVAAFAASLSIVVKPSGTLVAAIAGVAWVVFAITQLVAAWRSVANRRPLILRLVAGALVIGAFEGLVLLAAVTSRYLSHDNMHAGLANIAIMKSELTLPLALLWPIVHEGFGGQFLIWIALSFVLIPFTWRAVQSKSDEDTPAGALAAAFMGVLALLFGVWFWLIGSGGVTQIRYGLPFLIMGLIWLLPAVAASWRVASVLRGLMMALMVAASLNILLVLLVPKPSDRWQKLSGVGVRSKFQVPVMRAYERLIELPRTQPVVIYAFDLDMNDAVLDAVADKNRLLHSELPPISVTRPVDWVRPSTFRLKEILAADYILITPSQGSRPPGDAIEGLGPEQGALTYWADQLSEADGVSVFLATNSSKILRIEDRQALRRSLDRMVASHHWDAVFAEANRPALQ